VNLPDDPHSRWSRILDKFEWWFAAYDGYMMWMVDLIRALMTCRGVEHLYPGSSHYRLRVSRWREGPQARPPLVSVSVDRQGTFTLTLVTERHTQRVLVRQRVASAVKAVRVLVRQFGVRLGPPRREQPPPEAVRRVWLVFPGGRWNDESAGSAAAADRPRD
jgi:hypothetical protein